MLPFPCSSRPQQILSVSLNANRSWWLSSVALRPVSAHRWDLVRAHLVLVRHVFPIAGVSARYGPALLANVCFSKHHFTSPCISLESGFPPSFLVTSFGDGSRISSSEKASRFHAELNAHLLGSPPLRELLRVRSHHVHCSSWRFCCPWLSSPLNSAAYFCAPRISYNFMSG